MGREPSVEVGRMCGELAAELAEMVATVRCHRETITAGAWHAADPSHLSDGEQTELAYALARLAGAEDEIEEFFTDPGLNQWPGARLMSTARPPLRAPVPGVEPEASAGAAGRAPAARPET